MGELKGSLGNIDGATLGTDDDTNAAVTTLQQVSTALESVAIDPASCADAELAYAQMVSDVSGPAAMATLDGSTVIVEAESDPAAPVSQVNALAELASSCGRFTLSGVDGTVAVERDAVEGTDDARIVVTDIGGQQSVSAAAAVGSVSLRATGTTVKGVEALLAAAAAQLQPS